MKVPKIRFKGFEGDWDIKNLWNNSKISTWTCVTDKETSDNYKYPVISGWKDIMWYYFEYNRKPNTITIARAWTAWFVQLIKSPFYLNDKCFSVISNNEIFNTNFLFFSLKNSEKNIMNLRSSTSVPTINTQHLNSLQISLPSLPEQEKIWSLFEQLDSHISKNQQKLEKLKNMKQSFLQKLFPKDWSALPKMRFKGFEGAWEEKKLGEIFEEYSEKNHTEFPVLTIMQWIGTMLRSEVGRNLQYNKNNVSNYKLVNKDDFIVHLRSFEWGLEKSNHTWIVSPAYHILHWENINSVFYYVYFRSFNFINQKLISHVYWIRDWKSIDIPWMKTIKIPYTSFKEQEKIGNFIQKIELQITKQQEKLEKLQNLKQSLLEKMFI